jgi:non-canonical poly(A) RNA polymerase PAPD5/7
MSDSYRPQRPPSLADRVTFTSGGGGSSYRPGASGAPSGPRSDKNRRNQPDFTFTSGRPGPQFPPAGPEGANQSQARRRNNRGGRGGRGGNQQGSDRSLRSNDAQSYGGRHARETRGRGAYRGFHKPAPHERALLQNHDVGGPEHTLGVVSGSNRFLDLDDLSASEEEMDIDDDKASDDAEAEAPAQQGRHKVTRTQSGNPADGDSLPKWSNPDPYTVLPPPSDTTGKKRDFVQLIRKAKNQDAENPAEGNAVAANNDFISLDDDDEEAELSMFTGFPSADIPPPPPRGPPPVVAPPPPPPSAPPPSYPLVGSLNDVVANGIVPGFTRFAKRSAEVAGLPKRPQHPDAPAAKRKRGLGVGGITSEWLSSSHAPSAPWCKNQDYAHLNTHPNYKNQPDYEKMLML